MTTETESEPRHGSQGWNLIHYHWDSQTGDARFTYQRAVPRRVDGHQSETREVIRSHKAWATPNSEGRAS